MKFSQWFAAGALWASLTSGAFASVLVSTNFDTGYTLGSINGQSPSDIGMSGAYTVTSSTAADVTVVSTSGGVYDLTYNVVGGGTISSGAQAASFKTNNGAAQTVFSRSLSTPITGQSVYLSYVIKPITASTSSSDDIGLTFATSGIYGLGIDAPSGGGAKAGVMMDWNNTATAGVNLTLGVTSLLVAEFVWDGTRYSQAKFWLNPTATASSTPDATTALNASGPTSLTTFALKSANMTPFTEYAFDSVTLGTTWTDAVATVPEPSTYAMLLGGVGVLLGMQRARKRSK